MKRLMTLVAVVATGLTLAGCNSMAEKAEALSGRTFPAYALNKSYASVAALPDYESDTLGRVRMFGDEVGSFTLANGDVVHRHAKREQRSTSSVDIGIIRNSESASYRMRLTYFRVGPDGIVRDFASGFVDGGSEKCISYVAGLMQRCQDMAALNRTLIEFDAAVRTRDGQTLAAWGPALTDSSLPVVRPDGQ